MNVQEHVQELGCRQNAALVKRQGHESTWQEIADYVNPLLGDVGTTKRTEGAKRTNPVFDSTAMISSNIFDNFVKGSIFPSSSPWFGLRPPFDYRANEDVVRLLDTTRDRVLDFMANSNFYTACVPALSSLTAIGNTVMTVREDTSLLTSRRKFGELIYDNVPISECVWSSGFGNQINFFCRTMCLTAGEADRMFSKYKNRPGIREALERGPNAEVEIKHYVFRNENSLDSRTALKVENVSNPWVSQYVCTEGSPHIIHSEGLDLFPYVVGRWHIIDNEFYGRGIGHLIRPDAKGLNLLRRLTWMAADRDIRPPLLVSDETHFRLSEAGSKAYVREDQRDPRFMEVSADYSVADAIRRQDQQIVHDAYMISALSDPETEPRSAEESRNRVVRALQRLSAPSERVGHEFLDPILNLTITALVKGKQLPELSQALEIMRGDDIGTYLYTSPFFQAQRQAQLNLIYAMLERRLALFAATNDRQWIDDIDTLEIQAAERELGGVPVRVYKTKERLNREREALAQAAAVDRLESPDGTPAQQARRAPQVQALTGERVA